MTHNIHWLTAKRVWVAAMCASIIAIAGCSRRSGLRDRIDTQIRYEKDHPRHRGNLTQQTLADDIAAALKTVTPESLASPAIASAVYVKENRESAAVAVLYRAFIGWKPEDSEWKQLEKAIATEEPLELTLTRAAQPVGKPRTVVVTAK
jgi:hypothetical protein